MRAVFLVAGVWVSVAAGDIAGPPLPRTCSAAAWNEYHDRWLDSARCFECEPHVCARDFGQEGRECRTGTREVRCVTVPDLELVPGDGLATNPTLAAHLASVTSSSTMKPGAGYQYGVDHLVDGELTTSWQPVRTPKGGVGEWVLLTFDTDIELTGVAIANGMQVEDKLGDEFLNNSRLRIARLVLSDKRNFRVTFPDAARGLQLATLDCSTRSPCRTRSLRLVVEDVYPGLKWKDLAISELVLLGAPVSGD